MGWGGGVKGICYPVVPLLTPFLVGRVAPFKSTTERSWYPYSNLSTAGPCWFKNGFGFTAGNVSMVSREGGYSQMEVTRVCHLVWRLGHRPKPMVGESSSCHDMPRLSGEGVSRTGLTFVASLSICLVVFLFLWLCSTIEWL